MTGTDDQRAGKLAADDQRRAAVRDGSARTRPAVTMLDWRYVGEADQPLFCSRVGCGDLAVIRVAAVVPGRAAEGTVRACERHSHELFRGGAATQICGLVPPGS